MDSITLTWQPAADDDASRVTGYVIEKRDATKTKWTHVARVGAHVRRYDVTGLTSGSRYFFRVKPVGKAGAGEATEYEKPINFDWKCRKYLIITHISCSSSDLRVIFCFI